MSARLKRPAAMRAAGLTGHWGAGLHMIRTYMLAHIPVYAPNISTESLINLLSLQMGEDGSLVFIERFERRVSFRAPEFRISLDASSPWLKTKVVQELIEASRLLGATQFTFEHTGFSMRRQPTNLAPEKIERLLIASQSYDPIQVNIF